MRVSKKARVLSIGGCSLFALLGTQMANQQVANAAANIGYGLSQPLDVAVDSSGHVFVTDSNGIVEMNADGSGQTTIASAYGLGGLAIDSSDHVFVLHSLGNPGNDFEVIKMNADGSSQTSIASGFNHPNGIAVDSSGHIFVADSGNNRVVEMNADGSGQTTIYGYAYSLAADSFGHVFVNNGQQVVEMNADGSGQTTIYSNSTTGVAVDSSGHVFVNSGAQVVEMNADGSGQTTIASGVYRPYGLAVDSSDHVFVADGVEVVNLGANLEITTSSVPDATHGRSYTPVQLQVGSVSTSRSPYVTKLKWGKGAVVAPATALPKGMKLSSSGVLSGTPSAQLSPGQYSVVIQVTETVTTVHPPSLKKVVTTIIATASIPINVI